MRTRSTLPLLFLLPWATQAADPLPGHSLHGEAFNEGPRQAAVIIPGTGKVDFPITTKNAEAQTFFTQGVGQIHGFWYYEAERSFRQAALLDPECAMAYWGMAMANVNNETRARSFIRKASALKNKAGAREKLWITALENFYKEDKRDKKQRTLDLISELETIVQDYPGDVEAKAFLAWKIWHGKDVAPISSPQAVDALLDQVFAANPQHPAHHYRIHLWDGSKPVRALKSAASNGQAAPGIAHMWHMPGHTFSKLRRHDDAAWQQEASTRVDHAYMIQNWILPDQIHNYAHNEEWLVRTYNELGRARDAAGLATSLIEIPRHPSNNTLDKGSCTASYGRTRLLETLQKWELWLELLRVTDGPLVGPVEQDSHEAARLRARGVAAYFLSDSQRLGRELAALEALQKKAAEKAAAKAREEEAKKAAASKTASAPAKPANDGKAAPKAGGDGKGGGPAKKADPIAAALAELRALKAVLDGGADAAALVTKAEDMPKERQAALWLRLGDKAKAEGAVKNFPQDLAGTAARAEMLHALGKREEARKALEDAGKLAFAMDSDLPVAARLAKLAPELGIKGGWRAAAPVRADSGARPPLASLGPVHWHPPAAPRWEALDLDGKAVSSAQFAGKPHVLIFYLGSACTHCMTQVNAFAKAAPEFEKAGIKLAAITREPMSLAGRITEQMTTKALPPFPVLCDPSLAAFKTFRAYDDFEEEPLHAAILVDAQGRLRWLDVSWQPFTDTQFLLKEATRLLSLPVVVDTPASGRTAGL